MAEFGGEESLLLRVFSTLSSVLFEPGLHKIPSVVPWIAEVWDSLGYNVLPDLVSLAETAWIIRLASRPLCFPKSLLGK